MDIRNRMVKRLPERLKSRLRRPFIPDETNVVYQTMKEHAASGVMLDVGACMGHAFSSFAHDGWRVYAFEPDPVNRNKLTEGWGTAFDVPFFRSDVDNKTVPLGYTFDDLAGYVRDLKYHVLVSEWYPIVNYGGRHRLASIRTLPLYVGRSERVEQPHRHTGSGRLFEADRRLEAARGYVAIRHAGTAIAHDSGLDR